MRRCTACRLGSMKSAEAKIVALPLQATRRRGHERAFPPAARAIGGTIIAFFALALAWSFWGSVDIVATAPGKIIPTGRTKIIQPLESGVVRAIHVQDGQKVESGDVLIEIDTTISASERDRLQNDYIQAELD